MNDFKSELVPNDSLKMIINKKTSLPKDINNPFVNVSKRAEYIVDQFVFNDVYVNKNSLGLDEIYRNDCELSILLYCCTDYQSKEFDESPIALRNFLSNLISEANNFGYDEVEIKVK